MPPFVLDVLERLQTTDARIVVAALAAILAFQIVHGMVLTVVGVHGSGVFFLRGFVVHALTFALVGAPIWLPFIGAAEPLFRQTLIALFDNHVVRVLDDLMLKGLGLVYPPDVIAELLNRPTLRQVLGTISSRSVLDTLAPQVQQATLVLAAAQLAARYACVLVPVSFLLLSGHKIRTVVGSVLFAAMVGGLVFVVLGLGVYRADGLDAPGSSTAGSGEGAQLSGTITALR